jgi:polar amino acid transport system substrate-binding protein
MTLGRFNKTCMAIAAAAVSLLVSTAAHADRLADIRHAAPGVCHADQQRTLGFPDPATRQIVGFDVDMCNAVAKQLGVKLEHKGSRWRPVSRN